MEPLALASFASVDRTDAVPLSKQLYRSMRDAIRAGRIPAGARLPSSRAAAAALSISRNTVVAAYDLLRAEGAIEARQGAAPRVLAVLPSRTRPAGSARPVALGPRGGAVAAPARAALYAAPSGWFMPGAPDERLFPRAAWARALRKAALLPHGPASGYADYAGRPSLRDALAARLATDRGLVVSAEQILVVSSAQAAFTLLAQVLAEPGDRALVEAPGYAGARASFAAAGLEALPIPVDAAGADITRAEGLARLAYVTPSNQYPLGVRMALHRREALADWARRSDAWIIEDDYDGEFHWRGRAVATLQSIAPDVTLYVGSAAKSLMPGLRLGWIAVPEPLVAPLREGVRNLGLGANLHAQAAFETFVDDGSWRAHIRRIAAAYSARGTLLADALEDRFGAAMEVSRPDGGLQLVARLSCLEAEDRAMAALGEAGFAVAALSRYGCGEPGPPGLVIGFADAEPALVDRFCAALAAAVR
ncbi:PLP-dependent aminotransferase family protein [Rhodosalinus sp. K401]|uniref:MocR-like pyridoxine biosynthesis transcription factor PdxR n=1 Tax=Rhodosalinus sp. K401 TaxID=3239195 RepID=UPI00352336FF